MSTEKHHSLTVYAIYLIVPGRESPLELKRYSESEGQLHTGSQALHLPLLLLLGEVNCS